VHIVNTFPVYAPARLSPKGTTARDERDARVAAVIAALLRFTSPRPRRTYISGAPRASWRCSTLGLAAYVAGGSQQDGLLHGFRPLFRMARRRRKWRSLSTGALRGGELWRPALD
jgi:hypothetical protein